MSIRWSNHVLSQCSSISWTVFSLAVCVVLLILDWSPVAASACKETSCQGPHSECKLLRPKTFSKFCQLGGAHVKQHNNTDWVLRNGEEVSGSHCGVRRFVIPEGITAFVRAWDGLKGGAFLVEAYGNVVIAGTLQASGKGYRGGQRSDEKDYQGGQQGESVGNTRREFENDANAGGGGGGSQGLKYRNHENTILWNARPGGGGGHGTPGDAGRAGVHALTSSNKPSELGEGVGLGGKTYGDTKLLTFSLGSGGGSGGSFNLQYNPPGGKGGNGGGAVQIISRTGHIVINGSLLADGEDGEGDKDVSFCGNCSAMCQKSCTVATTNSARACWDLAGPGGGGSGGSIYLRASSISITGQMSARGGRGGVGISWLGGCGGSGGDGRIRIDVDSLKGQSHPLPGHQEVFSTAMCVCADGYSGNSTYCQPVCNILCVHGRCLEPNKNCKCDKGYSGASCNVLQNGTSPPTTVATDVTTSEQGNHKGAAAAKFEWLWLSFVPVVLVIVVIVTIVCHRRRKQEQADRRAVKVDRSRPNSFQFYATGTLSSALSWPSSNPEARKLDKLPEDRIQVNGKTRPAEPTPNPMMSTSGVDGPTVPDRPGTVTAGKHLYDQLSVDFLPSSPNGTQNQPTDSSGYLLPTDSINVMSQSSASASFNRGRSMTVSITSLHSYEQVSHKSSVTPRQRSDSTPNKPHLYASVDDNIHEVGMFNPGPASPTSVFSVSTVSIDLPRAVKPLPTVSEGMVSPGPWCSSSRCLLLPTSPTNSTAPQFSQSPPPVAVSEPQTTGSKNTTV